MLLYVESAKLLGQKTDSQAPQSDSDSVSLSETKDMLLQIPWITLM